MKELQDDLKIYSEEVRDILSEPPKAIFKWGNTILFGFIIILAFLSWFIKYPDIIRAEVTITTLNPPEKLIARTSGRIKKIWIKNQSKVEANSPIAIIDNSANYEKVFLLKSIIDTLSYKDVFYFPFDSSDFSELGSIESTFTNFKNNYVNYRQLIENKPYQVEINSQSFEYNQQLERIEILKQQIQIAEKEIQFKKGELSRYQQLYEKGVISTHEWETHQFNFFEQEKSQRNLKTQLSQLKSSLNELFRNKQSTHINQLKDNEVLFQSTVQSFNLLKKEIADWDMNYVLRSSIKGKVSYFQVWSENQAINVGEQVFSIIPESNTDYIAKINASSTNSGKLKVNQKVVIRLSNYPEREFGVLNAAVLNISLIPTSEGITLIDAKLTDNLVTTYGKQLIFQQEMSGIADIITEDLRLIERLLYQLKDIFRR